MQYLVRTNKGARELDDRDLAVENKNLKACLATESLLITEPRMRIRMD
jgi:hypothetical protein